MYSGLKAPDVYPEGNALTALDDLSEFPSGIRK